MSRFFVKKDQVQEGFIDITNPEDINHITKVLRLSQNNIIIICDGNGMDYEVCIAHVDKNVIQSKILRTVPSLGEPHSEVVLYQGVAKGEKMEWVIQKAVELGVCKIVPVITQRTVVKVDAGKGNSQKLQRWQRVAYEAAKQCNRGRIPQVDAPIPLRQALQQIPALDFKLMPYEKETNASFKQMITNVAGIRSIGVLIGPEGGFEEAEVEVAESFGFRTVSLGSRILRTETAAIAVLAILMHALGDM